MRVLRRRLNLTLHGLAERSGLTYPTVESIETNKTLPSLKTLDALAGALQISASDLISLAERRLVQRRKAEIEQRSYLKSDKGLENCRVARYDKGKLIRVTAEPGDHVHVMGLHEDVHEFCYVSAAAWSCASRTKATAWSRTIRFSSTACWTTRTRKSKRGST
jgi:transcriptional regulator with XRE-family HTH domain